MQIPQINFQTFNIKPPTLKKESSNVQSERLQYEKSWLSLSNLKANYLVNFKSLKADSETPYKYLGTAFYRDLFTMMNATKLIQDTFPEGTDILEFAASNGEEAITLHTLINDKHNIPYPIHSYDVSDKAINYANLNIHSVFCDSSDGFLINPESQNAMYKDLARCFFELMEEIPEPDSDINDKDFMNYRRKEKDFSVKYYKVKDEYLPYFKIQKGDIRNLPEIVPEKQVGAIFFRNAFYHLTNNHIFEHIFDKPVLDKIWYTNKDEVIEDVVSKVYDKLLPGGFFVIGNDEKEHVYQADKFTPREEYYFDDVTDEYIRLKSPLEKALLKDGRFKPVVTSKCYTYSLGDFSVHTVWQKVEKEKDNAD